MASIWRIDGVFWTCALKKRGHDFTRVELLVNLYSVTKLSISLETVRSFRRAFLNFFPNKSCEPEANNSGSSIRSIQSDETFASRPFRRPTRAQYEALPTKKIARRTQLLTRAASKPVDRLSAMRELFHTWESGPKGSEIRAARFSGGGP